MPSEPTNSVDISKEAVNKASGMCRLHGLHGTEQLLRALSARVEQLKPCPAASREEIAVKPLEWRGHIGKSVSDVYELGLRSGQWGFSINGDEFTVGLNSGDKFGSENEAKDGAEELHKRRILSALTPTPEFENTDPMTIAKYDDELRKGSERFLARNQPCGCIVCHCEDDEQCQGCGAKSCGNHPVGGIPNPVYEHPATEQPSVKEAARVLRETRQIVCDAAETGFNCHDGDWAERLFRNNGQITAALRDLAGDK